MPGEQIRSWLADWPKFRGVSCSILSEEKKWRDPDDVYIDVERREEERKKQGLPSRLGVLPHSTVAEEERRWEAEQESKKKRPKSRGK